MRSAYALAPLRDAPVHQRATHKQCSSMTKRTKEVLDAAPNAPALLLAFPVGVLSLVTSTSAVSVQVTFDIIHLLVSRRNRPGLLTIVLRPVRICRCCISVESEKVCRMQCNVLYNICANGSNTMMHPGVNLSAAC